MSKLRKFLSNIKLVYRPGKRQTKLALLGVIALSTVALVGLFLAVRQGEAKNDALSSQAAALNQQNSQLEQNIDRLGSEDSIIDIAESELGLVDPDSVVLIPHN